MAFLRTLRKVFRVAVLLAMTGGNAGSQTIPSPKQAARESLNDARWTGPMLAPSAATLPRGHFLIEPYLYDVASNGSNTLGTLSYILYGLRNKLTVGLIPTAGYEKPGNGPSSSGVQLGDVSMVAQYGLTQFHEDSWRPATAINVQEKLPTGRYDRLGDRPNNGFGSGAFTTTLGFYSQTYFWLPNGRILRARFNVSQAFSTGAKVQGDSVYGTGAGFLGTARLGPATFVDLAGEYSLTRKWVLALDAAYNCQGGTLVTGHYTPGEQLPSSVRLNSGFSDAFILAPAIEYNWNAKMGVLFGTRVIEVGHNTPSSITPVVAINFVH